MQGNPTSDDNVTHWDEHGFLEIREEFDEQTDTSGPETDHEVLKSD